MRNTTSNIPEMLAAKPEDNAVAADDKMRKLKNFAELAEKASLFEFGMGVLGSIFTGLQSDWLAYTLETYGEFSENQIVAQ